MASLVFRVDTRSFDRMVAIFDEAGIRLKPALRRAINHTGDKARTQVARALVKQTGLRYGRVRQVMKAHRAGAMLVYRIVARDGWTSLKEFGARQTLAGVSAAPWRKRRVFPHTFIVQSLGGHVFERTGSARYPIKKLWGPAVPVEMVKDQTKETFDTFVDAELPARLEYEIRAIFSRQAPEG